MCLRIFGLHLCLKQKYSFPLHFHLDLLRDQDVLVYPKEFQTELCYATADEKNYVSRILREITDNNIYSNSLRIFTEINEEALAFCNTFGIKVEEESKTSINVLDSLNA